MNCWHFPAGLPLLYHLLLPSLLLPIPGDGLRMFHNRDSSVFTKNQIDLNCSEPICVGPFRDIYCQGPIIWAAWHFGLQNECPGTKMRFDARTVLKNFDRSFEQGKLHKEVFQHFCEENFNSHPYLEKAHLPDWRAQPKLLKAIRDQKMRMFAMEMHKIWPQLARKFVEDVHQSKELYPLLPVPNTFIISGNNVQMYYYWDTYWIFKGLLLSELFDTAKGILRNFAFVMKGRGHIPNSGFIKHQRRSQPPLFTQMVMNYFETTQDRDFLEEILPSVERELEWWRRNRTVQVRVDGEQYTAYIYRVKANCPRPESFMLDYYFAFESGREDLEYIWSSIISTVESGMDFSTRWFSINSDDDEMAYTRKGIKTNDIVPVDLNVLMAMNYQAVARFYGELGVIRKQKFYKVLAETLSDTIEAVFRDRNSSSSSPPSVWFDFDLAQEGGRGGLRRRYFPVNIFPLLLFADQRQGSKQWEADCTASVDFLKGSGALEFKGGIPSSMAKGSVERWDFPNGEPRLIHLTIISLLKCVPVHKEAWTIAKKMADGLLTTAFNGFFHPRRGMPAQIWEKYDVRFEDGRSGFGGDYIPQIGFGTTNGALLDLIRIFYTNSTGWDNQRAGGLGR